MAHTYLISGLLEHRSQIAGEVDYYRHKAREASDLLASIDRTLNSLGYEADEGSKKPVRTAGLFRRGELRRLLLGALREAPEGLTVEEMAAMVCRERGWETDDARWMAALRSKIGKSLDKAKGAGLVSCMEREGCWYWFVAGQASLLQP
ncbi:hypothetical protein [Parvularcula maris]|uniref:Uncharacterized protein n=1 Tax=Parvularcula maris TaxID=2965077 RepID=A0A9X2RJW8_9PROT|nr:hypothetical protein [Parvularcula maris]MCQ8185163.1 hypothetical protein [Parvularcula maris]